MSYSNRRLIRKPHALLRLNEEEMQEFEWLVQNEGGGAPAEIYRSVLLEAIRARRHAANPMSASRVDRNAFTGFAAA